MADRRFRGFYCVERFRRKGACLPYQPLRTRTADLAIPADDSIPLRHPFIARKPWLHSCEHMCPCDSVYTLCRKAA